MNFEEETMNTEAFEALAKRMKERADGCSDCTASHDELRALLAQQGEPSQGEEYRHWCQKGHERIGLMDYSGEGDDDCPLCIANRRIAELERHTSGDGLREEEAYDRGIKDGTNHQVREAYAKLYSSVCNHLDMLCDDGDGLRDTLDQLQQEAPDFHRALFDEQNSALAAVKGGERPEVKA
jgi:hypothetical protein